MIYGNPSYQHVQAVKNSILIQTWESAGILQPLLQMPYPCEMTTYQELLHVTSRIQNLSTDEIDYLNTVDQFLSDVWADYLLSMGISAEADFIQSQIFSLWEPLVEYLKLYYNRPRPFQLAAYHNLPLYPHVEHGSTESSYPSGHTFLSMMVYDYYGRRYPQLRKHLLQMVLDIADTRLAIGVHYPSDNLFAYQVYHYLKPHITAWYGRNNGVAGC